MNKKRVKEILVEVGIYLALILGIILFTFAFLISISFIPIWVLCTFSIKLFSLLLSGKKEESELGLLSSVPAIDLISFIPRACFAFLSLFLRFLLFPGTDPELNF